MSSRGTGNRPLWRIPATTAAVKRRTSITAAKRRRGTKECADTTSGGVPSSKLFGLARLKGCPREPRASLRRCYMRKRPIWSSGTFRKLMQIFLPTICRVLTCRRRTPGERLRARRRGFRRYNVGKGVLTRTTPCPAGPAAGGTALLREVRPQLPGRARARHLERGVGSGRAADAERQAGTSLQIQPARCAPPPARRAHAGTANLAARLWGRIWAPISGPPGGPKTHPSKSEARQSCFTFCRAVSGPPGGPEIGATWRTCGRGRKP